MTPLSAFLSVYGSPSPSSVQSSSPSKSESLPQPVPDELHWFTTTSPHTSGGVQLPQFTVLPQPSSIAPQEPVAHSAVVRGVQQRPLKQVLPTPQLPEQLI